MTEFCTTESVGLLNTASCSMYGRQVSTSTSSRRRVFAFAAVLVRAVGPGVGELILRVVVRVEAQPDLLEVVGAAHPRRGLAHLLHGRSKQPDQDAMIAMTTNSSINVKPRGVRCRALVRPREMKGEGMRVRPR